MIFHERGCEYLDTLRMQNFEIVAFYPYTSRTVYNLFEQDHNGPTEFDSMLNTFWLEIEEELDKMNIMSDNKIVVELRPKKFFNNKNFFLSSNIFVGFYDNIVSVGLGVYQPDDWTKKSNRRFDVKIPEIE